MVPALLFLFTPSAKISQALESGAEFLKIDTDARAVSMGSAYTAAADGVNSISYNPAGLASLKGCGIRFQPYELAAGFQTRLPGPWNAFKNYGEAAAGRQLGDGPWRDKADKRLAGDPRRRQARLPAASAPMTSPFLSLWRGPWADRGWVWRPNI